MYKKIRFFTEIQLPIIIGGLIYLLLRDKNILFFTILEKIGVDIFIEPIRNMIFIKSSFFTDVLKFSLPDGLYIFSFSNYFFYNKRTKQKAIYTSFILYIILIISEVSQLFFPRLGTFDFWDILFYTIGFIFSLFINKKLFLALYKKISIESNL